MTDRKELYIVDDSADHRFVLENIFTKFLPQYPVRFFEGAQDLYHFLILQSAPDYKGILPGLIILDLKMPSINGYELLKLLRKTPDNEKTQWRSLPVVMMSSEYAPQEIIQCYQAGANSYLTKPLIFEELRDVLFTTCQYWLDFNRSPSLN
ncbi:response regulator [Dyadobacter subterraneus]|uniref:Response regulator n=1 Tax=Dyadobacter subterraneus TaxID=2773304 RepID=A0ABR9WFG3_9BACT|nr:response regulator [Dyadobacter subterraneus]MBE9464250.1 response regulator [Dyadobacter subterraneus]